MHCQYNERVHRKEQRSCGINTLPLKIATLLTLETLKWEYSFATAVFTKLGSLLSGTSLAVFCAGGAGRFGHDHFGTRPFVTYSIRYIVTSGPVISGQV